MDYRHPKLNDHPDLSHNHPDDNHTHTEDVTLPFNRGLNSTETRLKGHLRIRSELLNMNLPPPSESRHTSPVPMFNDNTVADDDTFITQAPEFEKIDLQLMQSTAGKFYKYRGPRDENLNNMLEELDQLITPGPRAIEVVKSLNRRIDNWFDKKNCCNQHMGPITFSKDTIFLLMASLAITIYISVRLHSYSNSNAVIDWFISYSYAIVFCFTIYGMM